FVLTNLPGFDCFPLLLELGGIVRQAFDLPNACLWSKVEPELITTGARQRQGRLPVHRRRVLAGLPRWRELFREPAGNKYPGLPAREGDDPDACRLAAVRGDLVAHWRFVGG